MFCLLSIQVKVILTSFCSCLIATTMDKTITIGKYSTTVEVNRLLLYTLISYNSITQRFLFKTNKMLCYILANNIFLVTWLNLYMS